MGRSVALILAALLVPASAVAQASWAVASRPSVQIGVVDGDSLYLLSRVTHVLRLGSGHVAIADAAGVRYYDRTGRFAHHAVRRGAGPGEVQAINSLYARGDGSVIVWDAATRTKIFLGPDGRYTDQQQVLTSSANTAGLSFEFSWLASDTVMLSRIEPRHQSRAGQVERRPWRFVVADLGSGQSRELGTYAAQAGLVVSVGTPTIRAWQPFSPITHAATGSGLVYIGDSGSPEIHVYRASDGRLLRQLRLQRQGAAVTSAHLNAELERRVAATRPAMQAEVRRLWLQAPKPARFPYHGGFLPDSEGNLWVMDYAPPTNQPTMWTVLSPTGTPLARVRLPARFEPKYIDRGFVLGVARDEFDVEVVQLWPLTRT